VAGQLEQQVVTSAGSAAAEAAATNAQNLPAQVSTHLLRVLASSGKISLLVVPADTYEEVSFRLDPP
jgi:hypothetical protein